MASLRRATNIETGLFKLQTRHLLQFRQQRHSHREREKITDSMCRNAVATEEEILQDEEYPTCNLDTNSASTVEPSDQSDNLPRAFVRLNNLQTILLFSLTAVLLSNFLRTWTEPRSRIANQRQEGYVRGHS
jgi:hypothetical protein